MKRYIILIYTILTIAIFAPSVHADTHEAASGTRGAVQAAVDAAEAGDTVTVPADNETWTGYVNVNDSDLTIQGSGYATSIIHKYGFQIASGIDNVRITGFTFDGDAAGERYTGPRAIQIADSGVVGCKGWRIDNNRFVDYREASVDTRNGVYTIYIRGFSYGLIDNNIFHDCRGEVIVYCADGAAAWSRAGIGGYDNGTVFVEDNEFTISDNVYGKALNTIDGNTGARYVFRYNTVTDSSVSEQKWDGTLDNHGACYGCNSNSSTARGTYSVEIYENDITSSNASWKIGMNIRGGTGVIYNNTFVGDYASNIQLRNTRSYSETCAYGVGCENDEGYPCDDQIFDLYIWDNTDDASPISVTVASIGDTQSHIVVDRDFFLEDPLTYTAYAYPHELQGLGGDTTPPTFESATTATYNCSDDPKTVRFQGYANEYGSTCKYSADGDGGDDENTTYNNLNYTFDQVVELWHAHSETFACGDSYTFWVRCMDASENKALSSTEITFTVADPPGPASPTGVSIWSALGTVKTIETNTVKSIDIQ